MNIDEIIGQMKILSRQDTSEVMKTLDAILSSSGEVTSEAAIVIAYIAGIEDALTGMAGRPEYDLRRQDFVELATNSLSDTGRMIGQIAMDDLISQVRDEG